MADWESNRQWALDELRPVYPSNIHTDTDWETAARQIAGHIGACRTDRATLLSLTQDFAVQQDAKGWRDSQYVANPARHFDGSGKWKGPFKLPAPVAKPREEGANERITRKLASRAAEYTALPGECEEVLR
jgi:hypothetical protein